MIAVDPIVNFLLRDFDVKFNVYDWESPLDVLKIYRMIKL